MICYDQIGASQLFGYINMVTIPPVTYNYKYLTRLILVYPAVKPFVIHTILV